MKKYLILILAIATMALYAGTSMAWMNATMLGGGVEAAAPAVSYIFEEDFDASGDCYSGDSTYNNCDNEWTNPDVSQVNFQASGLDGTYGVDIDADGSDYDYISIAITDTSHAYGYFIVNYDTMSASTTRTLFEIKGNNGTVTIFKITVAWDEEPSVYLGAVGDENTDADLSMTKLGWMMNRLAQALSKIIIVYLLLVAPAFAGTYWVDPSGGEGTWANCEGADPGAGSRCALSLALTSVTAGDTVNLMSGDYDYGIIISNISGTAENKITFQAGSGQTPVIKNAGNNELGSGDYDYYYSLALYNQCDYFVFDGITFEHQSGIRFVGILNKSDYNEIQN